MNARPINAEALLLVAGLFGLRSMDSIVEDIRERRQKGLPCPPPRSRHDAVREVVDRGTSIENSTWVFACPLCRFRRTYATDSGVTTRAVEHVMQRHPEVGR